MGLLLWQWDSDDYGPDHKMMWLLKMKIKLLFMLRSDCGECKGMMIVTLLEIESYSVHSYLLYQLVSNLIYSFRWLKYIVWAFRIAAEHDHEHCTDGNHHILPKYNIQFFPLKLRGVLY